MEPSSADRGFFQQQPVLQNQVYEDVSFQRVMKFFMPPALTKEVEPEIAALGEEVISPQIYNYITDAERNLPYLKGSGRDAFGKQTSELVTSEGWRKLQDFGKKKGMVAYNYDTNHAQFSRFIQMLRVHLWGGSCANTMCPGAMTDGAARLLEQHLGRADLDPPQRRVLQDAFDRLTSRDPSEAWTSGQWMTERTGGSDVSLTETTAAFSPLSDATAALGSWSVTGFKFFSSATDSDMTILLARTSPSQPPSAFFAPMRLPESATLNGIRISRLKDKLGTRPVPTAELELAGLRAHLLGAEGRGVAQLGPVLAITRAHSAVASLAYLGRALAVARSYALVRTVGAGRGRRVPLCRSALHVRTLAGVTAAYRGLMLLVFLGVYVLGLDETASRGKEPAGSMLDVPPRHVEPLARVLGSLVKAYACKAAVPLLFACLEALGGVGYLNNAESEVMNVARLFRDGCVNSIWEGTTDVLSADLLRVIKHPISGVQCLDAFGWLLQRMLGAEGEVEGSGETEDGGRGEQGLVLDEWVRLKARLETETQDDLASEARDVLFRMAEMLVAALLVADWRRDGAPDALVVYRRFMVKSGFASASRYPEEPGESLEMDTAIVYGKCSPQAEVSSAKL